MHYQNKSIPNVESTKFLGVHIDSRLDWESHIYYLQSKLNSACALIRRLRNIVSLNSIITFYYACVQSHLNYAISSWGGSQYSLNLFRTQKRILRCMLKLHPRTSCKPYFVEMGILTLPSLYFLALVIFVKRNPHYFLTNREGYAGEMSITTRGRNELRVPHHVSAFYERGPHYKCIKAFQILPQEIRGIARYEEFRKAVIQFLKEKCFYSFVF